MSLAAAGRIRMDMCSCTICLDSFENSVMSGWIYHSALEEGIEFHSFIEFVMILEQIFNELDYPQSSMELRSFQDTESDGDTESLQMNGGKAGRNALFGLRGYGHAVKGGIHGKMATLSLRVMFRQNASWQGTIRWLEQKEERGFRSVLELIRLMESTVSVREDKWHNLLEQGMDKKLGHGRVAT